VRAFMKGVILIEERDHDVDVENGPH
jgi:hypothetical protein